ncbi:hypothetical protein GDO78_019923 [Eleutherodactylus coqui]|uniref:Uncharacterized protein n=1 Tax=Eleutherodactylus coqui TaxID=57060 RepID=A0A8J6BGA1_ELECQ|nr:hypothetical protein GDO78_019923 [Eleutherodactylus coqui]
MKLRCWLHGSCQPRTPCACTYRIELLQAPYMEGEADNDRSAVHSHQRHIAEGEDSGAEGSIVLDLGTVRACCGEAPAVLLK